MCVVALSGRRGPLSRSVSHGRGPRPEGFVWPNGLDWLVVSSELEHFGGI